LRKEFFYILFISLFQVIYSQGQAISGVVNYYYKVNSIFSDHIVLENIDLSNLHAGDKVILMQMTGVEIPYNPSANQGISNFGPNSSAGRYEMLAVSSVNNGNKEVSFTVNLNTLNYSPAEKFQLIKIYEADYATVTGTLTADSWDGNKGGVVAMVIYKKLTLNANIDVSGKGFRGAVPEPYDTAVCRASHDIYYFSTATMNKAGIKGEGNIKASWIYTKGPGRVVTGGGGGLGYFAGAGGGGNYGPGGQGGIQKEFCPNSGWNASGGFALGTTTFYGFDRVTLGGGGGGSTQHAGYISSKGGNGGGIVILLVDTLEGGAHYIFNQGEGVTTDASAGAGGGGAGGSILLDVNVYASSLTCNVNGGKGGNTTGNTGAGGGGGGGLIWHAGSGLSGLVSRIYAGGARGTSTLTTYRGYPGEAGGVLANLSLPLNGFLFNSVNGAATICAGQQPRTITGSMPKGGESAYSYEWLQSTDSLTWSAALGTGDSLHFQPNPLIQTTFFTRRVISGVITDIALPVKVFVYPKIKGNTLEIKDTLCTGADPVTLMVDSTIIGGNGTYGYQWNFSTNQLVWNPGVSAPAYTVANLTQTTYFRRIVTSAAVCVDTSNIDILTILPSITNNGFSTEEADTAICANLDGGTIHGDYPGGGDGSYSYQWLFSADNSNYGSLSGETSRHYSPPDNLTSGQYYYRRTVYSGEGNACIDTSVAYRIAVYPSISGNLIHADSSRYCYNNSIDTLEGDLPAGGDAGHYAYRWFNRLPGESWAQIAGAAGISYFSISNYTDTTQLCRVVLSGGIHNACIDSSNIIQIDIIPRIFNTLVSNDTAICEGGDPLAFVESPATGGAGGLSYTWQSRILNGAWMDAPPTNNTPSYNSGSLTQTTEFRRNAHSQICISNSNVVEVTVYPSISNNIILGPVTQYTCFNSEKVMRGGTIGGGNQSDIRFNWQESVTGSDSWIIATGSNAASNYTSALLIDSMFFRRVVLSGSYNQCVDTSAAVLIRINPLPTGDIVSSIDTACAGDNITISYTALTGNAPWSIDLGDESVLHTESGITTSSGVIHFPVTESGQIRMLDLSDDSLCHSALSGNTGLVELTVFEKPIANAGTDTGVCGLEISMAAIPTIGLGNWDGTGITFDSPHAANSGVTAGTYGIYNLEWTEINWQCESTDEVELTFFEQPETPNAGENQLLDYSFATTLDADLPAVGEGYWQFNQGIGEFEDSTLYNTVVKFYFPNTGNYILLWTVINGLCPAVSDTVSISVGEPRIFNGFSPNGDQINDSFLINLSDSVDCQLIILDRWGNQVYSTSARDILIWQGENEQGEQGEPMPEGTYFYIFKQTGLADRRGFIELRR
jgi:gliding motility-associated-like protein